MSFYLLPLLLLFFLCINISSLSISGYGIKDLEGTDSISFQKEADLWNLSARVSSAKITQTTNTLKWLLGGPNILGSPGKSTAQYLFTRTYTNLPPHFFVGITGVFWYFDDLWGRFNNSAFIFEADLLIRQQGPKLLQSTDFTTFDGGVPGAHDLGRTHIKYGFTHREPTLTLRFLSLGTSASYFQSFGFRELHIHLSNYSNASPHMCHISEDINPLRFDQCSCALNQAKDKHGNCISCASNCDICFGPEASECLACTAGAYWDGNQCNTCDIACETCTGTTNKECTSCKYGFYNYENNTCAASCKFPFVAEKVGFDLLCKKKCTSLQFYTSYGKSCLDSCDPPLIHTPDENGIEQCLSPCINSSDYLYANGSCYSTCQVPLLTKAENGVKFCINPCSDPINDYLYSNRSCLLACPSPLLSRSEPGANYCWSPCPSMSYFLYNNGSCYTTCPAPLISRFESSVKYCYTPCPSVNDFIYDNRSCFSSCASPLMSRIEPLVARYCLNPCPSSLNYFLYPNGSCFIDCSWPLLSRTESGVKYCYNPCASPSDYIYPNSTCMSTCPYPLMIRAEPDFNYCYSPCPLTKYLYSDQSCQSFCDFPLIGRLEPSINYCNTPCDSLTNYAYSDGTCRFECDYPYKVLKNPVYKVCLMNTDERQINQAHSLANAIDIANTVCGVGGLFAGFVSPGDPTSMIMWSLLKMFQSTRFIDVNFPAQLTMIFSKQNENYIGNGYMSSIGGDEHQRRVLTGNDDDDLGKFSYYDIPHGFLQNYWQQLIILVVLIMMIIASIILLCFVANPKSLDRIKYLKSALQWNVVIMFFCGSYGDLILYSVIEFQSFSFENFASIMGFFACLLMVIFAAYIPLKILYVTRAIRKARINQPAFGQKDTEKFWAHNRVFFEAYKSDHAIQQIFLFIYLMRVGLFNLLIGCVFRSPLVQALLINFINFGMLIYLLTKTPIKDKFSFTQQVTMESMLLAYNLCLLVLVIMDLVDAKKEGTKAFFGGIMIVTMIMTPIGTAILIVLKVVLKIHELYQQYKAEKDAVNPIKTTFKFTKARSKGKFVIGGNTLGFQALNNTENYNQNRGGGGVTELDETQLVIIPKNDIKEVDQNHYLQADGIYQSRLNGEGSSMEINLERNIESSLVQVYAKKGPNLKRRKINVFKDDNYLPD